VFLALSDSLRCSFKIFKKYSFLLGLFVDKNPIFMKKNFRRSAVCRDFMAVRMQNFVRLLFERCFQVSDFFFWITEGMQNFVRPLFERCFQGRDSFFWITEGIGVTGVSFHF
jgi:hypothetical protein